MKKCALLLAVLLTLTGNLNGLTYANSPDDPYITISVSMEPNMVMQNQLKFINWDLSGNSLEYSFDGQEDESGSSYKLWNFYVAGYDYNKLTMGEAENNIKELGRLEGGEKPSWAAWQYRLEGEEKKSKIEPTRVTFTEDDGVEIGNAPGAVYYGLQLEETKSTGSLNYFWMYGKIDLRQCGYNDNKTPHMTGVCEVSLRDGGRYYAYTQTDETFGEAGQYSTWRQEWTKILNERLGVLEEEILAWDGNEEDEADFRERLEAVRPVAADTLNEQAIKDEVTRLEELIPRRRGEIAAEEKRREEERLEEERRREEERLAEEKRLEEEKRRQEEEAKRKEEAASGSTAGSVGGLGGASGNTGGSSVGADDESTGIGDSSVGDSVNVTDVAHVSAGNDNTSDDLMGGTLETRGEGDANDDSAGEVLETRGEEDKSDETSAVTEEGIAVPALYGSKTKWKWLLWPLIAGILMIVAGLIWRRREKQQDR